MALNLASGLVLKLGFAPGRLIEYKLSTEMKQEIFKGDQALSQQQHAWKAHLTQKILALAPDGGGHVVTVNMPEGKPEDLHVAGVPLTRQVVYTQMSAQGDILETTGPDTGAAFCFPKEAVREGQEWTGVSRLQLPGGAPPLEAVTHYKLVGTEEMLGFPCVKISLKTDETSAEFPVAEGVVGKITLSSEGTMHFAPEKGLLVRQDMTTRSVPVIVDARYETVTHLVQELGRLVE